MLPLFDSIMEMDELPAHSLHVTTFVCLLLYSLQDEMKGGQKTLHSFELITGVPEKVSAINLGKKQSAQQVPCAEGNVFETSKDDIEKTDKEFGNSQIPCIVVSQDSDDANENNDDTDFEGDDKSISESFLR
jgi:hypothetical protein